MALRIYGVKSLKDDYFIGVVLAENPTQARELAWKKFTSVHRPEEWQEYHKDCSEFEVTWMGDSYFSGDGNGRMQF